MYAYFFKEIYTKALSYFGSTIFNFGRNSCIDCQSGWQGNKRGRPLECDRQGWTLLEVLGLRFLVLRFLESLGAGA